MNTTHKHTPGPWIAVDNAFARNKAGETQWTFGPSFECLGLVYNRTSSGGSQTIEEANARLIAAAPELLSACRNAANVLAALATGQLKAVDKDSPALLQLRTAIAKAEGNA